MKHIYVFIVFIFFYPKIITKHNLKVAKKKGKKERGMELWMEAKTKS
jgi:hypothetical protein